LVDDFVLDRAKGELRILGRRNAVIDVEALCQHLDGLVGVQVAEVILDNHEVRLGREDAARLRKDKPQAGIRELVDELSHLDLVSGMGVTRAMLPEGLVGDVTLEVSNPILTATRGAAKALIFSYWRGALSFLLGKEKVVKDLTYDDGMNVLRCQIGLRVSG